MTLLGNVENGWFAQLAHGCEWAGRNTLNAVSLGGHWGDKLYGEMHKVVDAHVTTLNQQAIDQALQQGCTQHQALSSASAAMENIADPKTVVDLTKLFSVGATACLETGKNLVVEALTPDLLGALAPLGIGLAVLGGAYLSADCLKDRV